MMDKFQGDQSKAMGSHLQGKKARMLYLRPQATMLARRIETQAKVLVTNIKPLASVLAIRINPQAVIQVNRMLLFQAKSVDRMKSLK